MHNCLLNTTNFARDLSFIFYDHLNFSNQISEHRLCPNIVIFMTATVAVSGLSMILRQLDASPSPRLLQAQPLQLSVLQSSKLC